ncbi:acetyltransferase [Flavobacterium sp. 14A]|uniref:acetyltransferase n=1 Tax=Flavobacterium sp. 14A TaxID=2735896 RepID=UPI0015712A02|nr:acetyltransferase [Flavobacterium sp. 14A]NRT10970.1 acetyltransferase EpsM [Flavobacterium sp. 14A]
MYLFGGSGHCKVIIDVIKNNNNSYEITSIIDENPILDKIFGINIVREIKFNDDDVLFIAIGNNKIRKKISSKYSNLNYPVLIHSNAIIGINVSIAHGTVIMAGAIVNPDTRIGKQCIVNTSAVIEHDNVIEDFVHISPNAALAGNVNVGEGTQIGIGACVIQGVKIGKWCTIGAGSVVLKDVPDYAVVVGNPGKIIKYNQEHE